MKAKKQPGVTSNPSGPGSRVAVVPKPDLEALDWLRPTDNPQGGETVRSHQVNFHCRKCRARGSTELGEFFKW